MAMVFARSVFVVIVVACVVLSVLNFARIFQNAKLFPHVSVLYHVQPVRRWSWTPSNSHLSVDWGGSDDTVKEKVLEHLGCEQTDGQSLTTVYPAGSSCRCVVDTFAAAKPPDITQKEFYEYATEFCVASGTPPFTYAYDGVLNIPILELTGQLLILSSLFMDYMTRFQGRTGPKNSVNHWWSMASFLNVIVAVAAVALYFFYGLQHVADDEEKYVGYRKDQADEHSRTYTSGSPFHLFWVAGVVFLIIAVLWAMLAVFRANMRTGDHYLQVSASALLGGVGWGILVTHAALQAKVRDSRTLFAIAAVVAVACTLRVLSMMLKDLYLKVCQRLDQGTIVDIQTKAQTSDEKASSALMLLRYIGWTRVFSFVSMVVLTLLCLTQSENGVSGQTFLSWYEGTFIYVIVLFLLYLIIADVVLEISPVSFYEDETMGFSTETKAEMLRMYIVVVAFLWANTSNLSQINYVLSDKHHYMPLVSQMPHTTPTPSA